MNTDPYSPNKGKTRLGNKMNRVFASFSRMEWVVFFALFIGLFVSTILILKSINNKFLVTIPARGGTLTEGILGSPRFVNPILAISDADKDLTALIYSGLMRKMPDGSLVPDLAEKYDVSPDGLTYTFTLKNKIFFHDNTPVTADDVIYTITAAKDPTINSPKKVNWDGVAITKKDERTVVFTLKQRYASFLDATTIGILPSHLWKTLLPEQFSLSELNISAIGSGPYMLSSVSRTSSGIPASYQLHAFKKFALGEPYISDLAMTFFANEKDLTSAYASGNIEAINAISPESASDLEKNGDRILTTTLPRIFGMFVNQNQAPIFTDKNVMTAINKAIDKQAIVQNVLFGYGTPIDSPIPKTVLGGTEISGESGVGAPDIAGAKTILSGDGFSPGPDGILVKKDKKGKGVKRLAFSLATSDDPELKNSADMIKDDLAHIGIAVDVKIYDIGSLNQNIIRPRKYDALFFGQVVNHPTDLFAFWDSSQRNDPGLNIALYTNAQADKLLEDANGTLDPDKQAQLYLSFNKILAGDMPAVFVYSPDFIYAIDPSVQGISLDRITSASDRFSNIYQWYIETDRVWKIFLPQNKSN